MLTIGIVSFALATLAWLVLAILLLISWRGKPLGGFLIGAAVAQMFWAIINVFAVNQGYFGSALWVFTAEMVKGGAWLFFIGAIFYRVGRGGVPAVLKWFVFLVPICVLALGLQLDYAGLYDLASSLDSPLLASIMMVYSLFGMVTTEQLYRNNHERNRWKIKFLCLAIGGLFAYDFFFYGYSYLMNESNLALWLAKGVVSAAAVPFIAVSAARNPSWSLDVFVSRRFVFYTSIIVLAGGYLVLMSIGGYYVRQWGGSWGAFLQAIFVSGAIAALLVVLFSTSARAWLRVFLSKHFYGYRYDYRDEWRRIMTILSMSDAEKLTPFEKVIKTLAVAVESPSGYLWYKDSDNPGVYKVISGWRVLPPAERANVDAESRLVKFLVKTGWVVDLDEYNDASDMYSGLSLPLTLENMENAWLIVPLLNEGQLDGFVVLNHPHTRLKLAWEHRDLLKIVAQQDSIYLSQIEAARRLVEAQQFAAFNRLSAYMIHDLNNLVAQLKLVTRNAERHKNSPGFMEDAINTIDNAVGKMDRLLDQLKKGRLEQQHGDIIELNREIGKALKFFTKEKPVPSFSASKQKLYTAMNGERFKSVIEHLIRNAQDATQQDDGRIEVRLYREKEKAVIDIQDNGEGMDREFVDNRLFKPFDTTKGNAGMGIGAYQCRQLIVNAGGSIHVESQRRQGTTVRVFLPLLRSKDTVQDQASREDIQ